ncbi:MAG: tyrosine-protein phosphatase, partial [Acidobacteria bacterium]|nr:tyrosine-protein phosphatase [Acidobacteriota bacterium]
TDYELINETGIKYYFLPVNTLSPDEYKFSRFLEIISDPANCPVFVHCRRGADRTGTAVALYRIKVQKWSIDEAINEMQNGGYRFNSLYINLKSLVRRF